MTEEEINKKAEKHCNEVLCNAHEKCNEVIKCRDWRSRRAGYFCGYEQALKDFEKENAELKENFATFSKDGLAFMHSMKSNRNCIDCESKMSIQLTKAKELIEELNEGLDKLYLSGLSDKQIAFIEQLQDKAEQFLKE